MGAGAVVPPEGPGGSQLEGFGAHSDRAPARKPFSPSSGLPRQQHTCSESNRPWLFSQSPLSFRLKRRSSRSKCWGKSDCIRGAAKPTPPGRSRPHAPYLGASPAEQGEGELADGGDHQVHSHSLPGGAGLPGPPYGSLWGAWQAENAETHLKGIHGVGLLGQVGGVSLLAALVLVVQDEALGERRRGCALLRGAGGPSAGVPAGPQEGEREAPHLLLQTAYHAGQQPCLQALLGVGDEEVHVVALQLPPEGASLTHSLCGLPDPFSEGRPASVAPARRPSLGRAWSRARGHVEPPLPPEAAGQRYGGPRQDLPHSCLHHLLQGLHF